MGRRARTAAALAIAIASVAAGASGAVAALAPLHNRGKLEHVIHQKEKELQRVRARVHALYEAWLRKLAHRDQQKQNVLTRFEERAAACEGAGAGCSAARDALLSGEKERLSGEIQADAVLAGEPEPGAAGATRRPQERAQQLEEGIQQREAELAALPAKGTSHAARR